MNVQAAVYTNERGQDRKHTPWPLPAGWSWVSLDDLGYWTGGGTPSKTVPSFWKDGTIPWVSPKDMKLDVIGTTEDLITEEALVRSATKLVPAGSVLMVMRSGILRHSFPVARTDRPVTLNQDLRALTPTDAVDPSYLARYLARSARAVLDACSKDGTTVNSIDAKSLARFRVPVPPLAEQRRIVTRIDALFEEIAEGERALEAARKSMETYRRALLKAAVTGELTADWRKAVIPEVTGADVLKRIRAAAEGQVGSHGHRRRTLSESVIDPTLLPLLPDEWTWARLGEIGELVGGVTVDAKRRPSDPVTVPYLRVANVQRGRIDLTVVKSLTLEKSVAEKLTLQAGDVLLNEGGDRDKIGRGWVWESQVPDMVHQNHVFRVRLLDEGLNPFFVSHYTNEMGRSYFMERGKQTTNLASISMTNVSEIPVPIPPPSEAKEILRRVADGLAAASDTQHVLDAEASDVQRLRQSVLKVAFEGRLVPQDKSDEPAPVMLARIAASQAETPRPRRGRPSAVRP